jgi:hypothetical protein
LLSIRPEIFVFFCASACVRPIKSMLNKTTNFKLLYLQMDSFKSDLNLDISV